jgi:hypothetical protein
MERAAPLPRIDPNHLDALGQVQLSPVNNADGFSRILRFHGRSKMDLMPDHAILRNGPAAPGPRAPSVTAQRGQGGVSAKRCKSTRSKGWKPPPMMGGWSRVRRRAAMGQGGLREHAGPSSSLLPRPWVIRHRPIVLVSVFVGVLLHDGPNNAPDPGVIRFVQVGQRDPSRGVRRPEPPPGQQHDAAFLGYPKQDLERVLAMQQPVARFSARNGLSFAV